jgi:hypothetical protein
MTIRTDQVGTMIASLLISIFLLGSCSPGNPNLKPLQEVASMSVDDLQQNEEGASNQAIEVARYLAQPVPPAGTEGLDIGGEAVVMIARRPQITYQDEDGSLLENYPLAHPLKTSIKRELHEEGKEERGSQEKKQKTEPKHSFNTAPSSLGSLEILPTDIRSIILGYVGPKVGLQLRQVNKTFDKLMTGYDNPTQQGAQFKPQTTGKYIALWGSDRVINFGSKELKDYTPETIPSFLFCQLVGEAQNLPQEFWLYLKDTRVHTVEFLYRSIGDTGVAWLASCLGKTQVQMLNLSNNQISNKGVIALAKRLSGTYVGTLDLSNNPIAPVGAIELAKNLVGSNVHTVSLSNTKITAKGAIGFTENLQYTILTTLDLSYNNIGNSGAAKIIKNLQNADVGMIDLSNNKITNKGATDLAKNLVGTKLNKIRLLDNKINDKTQALLKKEYPTISWEF